MRINTGTVIINLKDNDLWTKVDKKNRWSVKKAEKLNIIIQDGGDIDACYKLYKKTCEENKIIGVSKKKMFSEGKLFTATDGENILAFSIIKEKNDAACLVFNSSDYDFRDKQANSLLYWKLILFYKKNGFSFFDLGGIDRNANYRHGNDRFKMRWGGEVLERVQKVNLAEFIWWKFFRHCNFFRNSKFKIQKKLLNDK